MIRLDLTPPQVEKLERQSFIEILLVYGYVQCNGKELHEASLNELRVLVSQIMRESMSYVSFEAERRERSADKG